MKFFFFSNVHFEKWDWRNSVEKGIGGSETSHVEMAWRLAARGHEVVSYAPIPDDCPGKWRNTIWKDIKDADFSQDGIWVIYRSPDTLDKFTERRPTQPRWLMCQDEDYGSVWTTDREEKVDIVLALCKEHAKNIITKHPNLEKKVIITSNGIKMDLIRQVESNTIIRNPKKLIYASSPDRGLMNLLKIFNRAKEYVPDIELHIFYGLDNIEKLIEWNPTFAHYKGFVDKLKKELNAPGIVWRGRVSQQQLYEEWLSAGIWCYPSMFTETSCITCMEAQALGAIPITNPIWAIAENVKHGMFIEGDCNSDLLVQARYAGAIVRLTTDPILQDKIRSIMMQDIRNYFNWERWVDQWEGWLYQLPPTAIAQFNFQLVNASGRILNIGCADDYGNMKAKFGQVVNLDVADVIPFTGIETKADLIADARELPSILYDRFDTVVLGDILEHFLDHDDIIKVLNQAKKVIKKTGKIIITCPDDPRPPEQQQPGLEQRFYINGVSTCHEHRVSKEILYELLNQANLEVIKYQEIDYTHFTGHGIVTTQRGVSQHNDGL